MGDPSPDEVLAWLARTGGKPAEAVAHFWPQASDAERKRRGSTVRSWLLRARRSADPPSPPRQARVVPADDPLGGEEGAADVPRPAPDHAGARLERVPFLERQLAELLADLEWSRLLVRIDQVSRLDARVSEVRLQLDEARAERGRVRTIERSPAVVADEMVTRQKMIEALRARVAQPQDVRDRKL